MNLIEPEYMLKPINGHNMPRVVIQGGHGAFHEIATKYYQQTNQVEIVPADTFHELVEVAENPQLADGALMAIENSIAGSILQNYMLVFNSNLTIIGEIYLRIKQNLMVIPGQRIEDLTEVYSHHMAIAQSRLFFEQYPHIKLIEHPDTALSAKMVRDNNMLHAGAIASSLAAEMYDMDIIGESIETNKLNYTRFLVLAHKDVAPQRKDDFDKVSISFSVSHEVGSLHKVLAQLAAYNANLTKIQSTPIQGKPWEYRFFVDYTLEHPYDYDLTIERIKPYIHELKILGKYRKGQHHED